MSVKKHKPGSFIGSLFGLVAFSAVAGVLVSATLTPAVALTSNATNSAIDVFSELPEFALLNSQAESSKIMAKKGEEWVQIATVFDQNRQVVGLDQTSPFLQDAAIAGEDRRFYEHGGVDAPSLIRAVVGNVTSGSVQSGASSLSMQVVRNQAIMDAELSGDNDAYIAAIEESYGRKLKEMKLAIGLEHNYTKNEILLAYLNIANFGRGTYGVEAASQRIFGKRASQLTLAESAALIATVQNPATRTLLLEENYERNQERRDYIIRQMANQGYVTAEQRDEALATPVDANFVNIQPVSSGCIAGYDSARFFCDYVQRVLRFDQVDDHPILGSDEASNAQALRRGGFTIYTTLDLDLNDAAQQTLDTYVPNTETRWESGGAVTQLEVSTGRILTMAQNKDFNNSENAPYEATGLNFNVDQKYGDAIGFQPGSAYKIFTLAAWIDSGRSVNETVNARFNEYQANDFTNSCGPTAAWGPRNNEGFSASDVTVTRAMVLSLNTAIARMATQVDLCDVAAMAETMGVHNANGDPLVTSPSSVIGSGSSVAPMSMANAFQTVANGGVRCTPIAIDRIVDTNGADVQPPRQTCTEAISPEVASVMQYVLQEVTRGNPKNNPSDGSPTISKTGTNNRVEQTWVNGSSTEVATSVWVGNIRGNQPLNQVGFWDVRSDVFTSVQRAANAKFPGSQFTTPDAETLRGNSVEIPNVAGLSLEEAQQVLASAGFQPSVGTPVAGAQAEGTAEYSTPGATTLAAENSRVTVYPSDGSLRWELPDLVGSTYAEAAQTLTALGLAQDQIQVTWSEGEDDAVCTVLAQNPEGGSSMGTGNAVSIVLGNTAENPNPTC
ncbi:transglycosylase domain-containing protein [Humidisolicoccus flavus]|uniref:transglycosylase domain-containing protein n=1 Tax=Humidisolicoccus flavus TaxID=3111414 RepID=UPI00324E9F04